MRASAPKRVAAERAATDSTVPEERAPERERDGREFARGTGDVPLIDATAASAEAPAAQAPRDTERFHALIIGFRPAMQKRALQLCRRSDETEDLVQDTFERALQASQRPHDPAKVRAWLIQILTNAFLDRWRRQKRAPFFTMEVDSQEVAAAEPREPLPWEDISDDDVRAAIGLLSDDVRDTYQLFALEGLSYQEISARLRIKVATVGTRIHRARRQLRKLLAPRAEEGR